MRVQSIIENNTIWLMDQKHLFLALDFHIQKSVFTMFGIEVSLRQKSLSFFEAQGGCKYFDRTTSCEYNKLHQQVALLTTLTHVMKT